MRNALTPVITLGALEFGTLLSGAVLTEQIFTIPGFGKLIVDAVLQPRLCGGAGRRAGHGNDLHRAQSARRHRSTSSSTRGCAPEHGRTSPSIRDLIAANETCRNAASPRRAPAFPPQKRGLRAGRCRIFCRAGRLRAAARALTTRLRKAGPRCAIRHRHRTGSAPTISAATFWRASSSERARRCLAGVISVGIALVDRRAARPSGRLSRRLARRR